MKDVDFAGLNSTIEDFEKTVGALERINDISRQTTETAAKIDALCKLLTDTSSHVVGSSNDVKQELSKFGQDFQRSATELLSVRGDIVESNEHVAETVSKASSTLETTLTARIDATSGSVSQELVAARQDVLALQNQLGEEERKLSEKLVEEASSLRTMLQFTGKRLEEQLQFITGEASKIQGIREAIDAANQQNAKQTPWIIFGSITACIAMIASIVGFFI